MEALVNTLTWELERADKEIAMLREEVSDLKDRVYDLERELCMRVSRADGGLPECGCGGDW